MSPGACRRRLGSELRALREGARLGLEDVGRLLQRSSATMSRLESGKVFARLVDVAALLEYYAAVLPDSVTPEVREHVLRLAAGGRRKQWFDPFRDVITGDMTPEHINRYCELETDASDIRSFEPDVMPGLLQTPDYAAAVAESFFPGYGREQRRRFVEFRLARQTMLDRPPDPVRMSVAIGESALRRPFGGPVTLCDQLRALLDEMRAGHPNISVRIVPVSAAVPAAVGGPFVVMSFADESEGDLVYLESRSGGDYLQSEADVERFLNYFESLIEASLSAADAFALIEGIIHELS